MRWVTGSYLLRGHSLTWTCSWSLLWVTGFYVLHVLPITGFCISHCVHAILLQNIWIVTACIYAQNTTTCLTYCIGAQRWNKTLPFTSGFSKPVSLWNLRTCEHLIIHVARSICQAWHPKFLKQNGGPVSGYLCGTEGQHSPAAGSNIFPEYPYLVPGILLFLIGCWVHTLVPPQFWIDQGGVCLRGLCLSIHFAPSV